MLFFVVFWGRGWSCVPGAFFSLGLGWVLLRGWGCRFWWGVLYVWVFGFVGFCPVSRSKPDNPIFVLFSLGIGSYAGFTALDFAYPN